MVALRRSGSVLGLVLLLAGCTTLPLARTPEIYDVNQVAILSLAIDAQVMNSEATVSDTPKSGLTISILPGARSETGPLALLAKDAQESFEAALGAVGWTVVTYDEFSTSAAYKALAARLRAAATQGNAPELGFTPFTRADEGEWVTPGSLAFVPLSVYGLGGSSSTTSITFSSRGAESATYDNDDVRRAWGKQAEALGVDALIVVQIKLTYVGTTASVPIAVNVELGAVDRQGRVVLDTGSGPAVYEGPAVALLQEGQVTLGARDDAVATAFRKLLNDAANDLAERITAEIQAEQGR